MEEPDLDTLPKLVAAPERPITSFDEDELDRGGFVDRLCNALINPKTGRATGVVIGITGDWGSGKSSVLNLLEQRIKRQDKYPSALIVRFDPWLVSGRDDLIAQFFSELVGTINGIPNIAERARQLAEQLASYGANVAPIGNLMTPGIGTALSGGLKAVERFIQRDQGLHAQRKELLEQLRSLDVPIVILVDELDRVEDRDIKLVAQLVRAVVDFPNISYVLAYDEARVVQALGDGHPERGRSYLEKIVQFQIPLPIAFDDELKRLLLAEMTRLHSDMGLPDAWEEIERFEELLSILIPPLIQTPRDVKRLVGTFHVLEGMVRGEVDWTDLLGYAGLVVKAPTIVSDLKREPDLVVDNPMTESAVLAQMSWDNVDTSAQLQQISPNGETGRGLEKLLGFLFPIINSDMTRNPSPDAIFRRSVFLTVLRLGLLPGRYSRAAIEEFFTRTQTQMEAFLRERIQNGNIDAFIDRLDGVIRDISGVDHTQFWLAVSNVLNEKSPEWLTQYSLMFGVCRRFAYSFERLGKRGVYSPGDACSIFRAILDNKDIAVTSLLLRSHIFRHGLLGVQRSEGAVFFNASDTEQLARSLSAKYRSAHLAGDWLVTLWHLNPVYTMLDTGNWDDDCRAKLLSMIEDDGALIGVTLLLYGHGYSTDGPIVAKLLDGERYRTRVQEFLNSGKAEALHETAQYALKRAVGKEPPPTDSE